MANLFSNLNPLLNGTDLKLGNLFGDLFDGIGGLFSPVNLGDIFQNLNASSGLLNTLDLGDIFQNFSDGNPFDQDADLDLGDVFSLLGGSNVFNTLALNAVLGVMDNTLLNGFTADDLLDDLSTVFDSVDLDNVFNGLNEDYYDVFDRLPIGDFVEELGELDFNTGVTSPDTLDLLDGAGEFLTVLGDADLLKNFRVNELIRGEIGDDVLTGVTGNSGLLGLNGNDRLLSTVGRNLLNGGIGNDVLRGGQRLDILYGDAGNDRALGGNGNDIIYGGAGLDTMVGGKGRDLFVVGAERGRNLIRDFNTRFDRLAVLGNIDLDDLDFVSKGRDTFVEVGKQTIAQLVGVDSDRLSSSNVIQLQ